jgi:3-oxoacyl-[acyl-carrier protein] reductase
MKLAKKLALVTGGSRGIGKEICLKFAGEGARIVANYARDTPEAEKTKREMNDSGAEYLLLKRDISKRDELESLIKETVERFGGVDILVNNAGVMITNTTDSSDFTRMMDVNVYAMYGLIEGLRDNFKSRGGKIINVSSVAGIGTALEGTTLYSITKGAVISLTRRYAFELGRYGVNVNAIAPGFTETDLTKSGKSREQWEGTVREISSRTMLGRIGRPGDIASAALFLASNDSDFITGQVLVVDGGRTDFLTHSL